MTAPRLARSAPPLRAVLARYRALIHWLTPIPGLGSGVGIVICQKQWHNTMLVNLCREAVDEAYPAPDEVSTEGMSDFQIVQKGLKILKVRPGVCPGLLRMLFLIG